MREKDTDVIPQGTVPTEVAKIETKIAKKDQKQQPVQHSVISEKDLVARIKAMTKKVKTWEAIIANLKTATAQDVQQKLIDANEEKTILENELTEIQKELETKQNEFAKILSDEITSLNKDINKWKITINSLKDKKDDASKRNRTIAQGNLNELNTQLAILKQEQPGLAILQQEESGLNRDIPGLQDTINIANLNTRIKTYQEKLPELREGVVKYIIGVQESITNYSRPYRATHNLISKSLGQLQTTIKALSLTPEKAKELTEKLVLKNRN